MNKRVAVVGAGFAGAVLAHELARSGRFLIDVFEARDHVAGNCHTYRDAATGVMVHQYGPHIFQTNREDVWRYVNRFAEFGPFTNRVKAITTRGVFSLPINLLTINQFFGKRMSPRDAAAFVAQLGDRRIAEPQNLEEQALKFLGRELYDAFFYGYTKKQWGVDPRNLPASILKRLPVRFDYDDNYYDARYQGIPIGGYTSIVEQLLDDPAIAVHLKQHVTRADFRGYEHTFYSGPLDAYFDYELGRLQYRTLRFERFDAEGDYQGNAVINYCEERVPFTRISEHKHFTPWESHEQTVCFREYSDLAAPGDTPYYPLRLNDDKDLLQRYVSLAEREPNVTFIGRLGTYRYLDMHLVIADSLDLAKRSRWPTFTQPPLDKSPERTKHSGRAA
ncbi:MAG TPA: UDP-galactopyranose mutase [Gemmatimonadales bacterium]|jgi:UDP-galactopyranose mutase|nr:UDP-galactopyranose mutase [Gemmatimonadales bacterium]